MPGRSAFSACTGFRERCFRLVVRLSGLGQADFVGVLGHVADAMAGVIVLACQRRNL